MLAPVVRRWFSGTVRRGAWVARQGRFIIRFHALDLGAETVPDQIQFHVKTVTLVDFGYLWPINRQNGSAKRRPSFRRAASGIVSWA